MSITPDRFQTLTLIMAASYLAVLFAARALPGRTLWVTIIAAHLVLLLGPPLISQDVFGYLDFARLGALHGLDPYTHVAAQVPTDSAYLFVGWPFQNSPYGPLFTLGSYAIAPLGRKRPRRRVRRALRVVAARGLELVGTGHPQVRSGLRPVALRPLGRETEAARCEHDETQKSKRTCVCHGVNSVARY